MLSIVIPDRSLIVDMLIFIVIMCAFRMTVLITKSVLYLSTDLNNIYSISMYNHFALHVCWLYSPECPGILDVRCGIINACVHRRNFCNGIVDCGDDESKCSKYGSPYLAQLSIMLTISRNV